MLRMCWELVSNHPEQINKTLDGFLEHKSTLFISKWPNHPWLTVKLNVWDHDEVSLGSAGEQKPGFDSPGPSCPAPSLWAALPWQWHVYFEFYGLCVPRLLRTCCVWQSWHGVQPDILSEQSGFLRSAPSVSGDESLKTSGLKKAPSYICLVSRRSCSFSVLHSFVLRLPFVLERLGTVFSIPRQLERVTGCSAIGPTGGEEADGSILTSPPSAWQRCQGASGEGFTCTQGTKYTYRCIHRTPVHVQSSMCVCGEFERTFFKFTFEAFTWHSCSETLHLKTSFSSGC